MVWSRFEMSLSKTNLPEGTFGTWKCPGLFGMCFSPPPECYVPENEALLLFHPRTLGTCHILPRCASCTMSIFSHDEKHNRSFKENCFLVFMKCSWKLKKYFMTFVLWGGAKLLLLTAPFLAFIVNIMGVIIFSILHSTHRQLLGAKTLVLLWFDISQEQEIVMLAVCICACVSCWLSPNYSCLTS